MLHRSHAERPVMDSRSIIQLGQMGQSIDHSAANRVAFSRHSNIIWADKECRKTELHTLCP